ncbi:CKLF-like MARVEL transmembrane domain-containing protein 2 isoform X2 [Choloepus didactylus]|uniref:CKLF-like MARVEL transmembrane domain-containing protein 2 isoform X2 n=1 Tax=Choloepus didactylus TaxID=27675 RepID=UPI00189CD63D|nr:CKLF-like MARVEL transmembrane domain-containing protein 2 isoform X2 [Choloepus didactylus]
MVPGDNTGAQPVHPQQPQPPSAPPAPPRPAEPPLRPVRPAPKARPVSSHHSAVKGRHGQSVASVRLARSSKARTGSRAPSLHHPSAPSKEDIKKRAEERAKVPDRYRDSLKRFFFSPTGVLKILRLGLEIGELACFIIAQAHESYIAITVLEICIVIFFILIYMVTLHHLLTCLHWPLLDLINSFITAVFLLIVAILAMQERKRRHLFFIGGQQSCVCSMRSWSPRR